MPDTTHTHTMCGRKLSRGRDLDGVHRNKIVFPAPCLYVVPVFIACVCSCSPVA